MRQRDVLFFYLPLFSSWLLMTAEGPIVSAAVNRLPDEVVMLAAVGVVFSLAVAIESPIINLLATSTALVRDRQSFLQVRRFTLQWMAGLTAIAFLLAYTPVFDLVVRRWLGTPSEVARWIQPGLQIMVLWSAAIAWRRFLQGILIAFGRTRTVAWGTALRLLTSGGTAIGLALWGGWPGVHLGATALMIGVVAEAIYATWAVRPLLRTELAANQPGARQPLTYRALLEFHLPLASTSVLTLLMQPLVTACLARLDRPVETLAAWPLVFHFLLLMRAIALALPEVVIALSDRAGFESMRRFSLMLTAVSLAAMLVVTATPFAAIYLLDIQGAAPEVAEIARLGLLLLIPLPALATLVSWLRGLYIHQRRTARVNEAMMVRLVTTAALLGIGLASQWLGIVTAAVALVVSAAAELIYLGLRFRRATHR